MTDDEHDDDAYLDDLDLVVRRAAHESMEAHRASIGRNETELALQSIRSLGDGSPLRGRHRRSLVVVSAAAALVGLIGALVVVGGGRNEQALDIPPPASDVATTIDVAATDVATSAPGSVPPTDVRTPAAVFDVNGNQLAGFEPDLDAEQSAFVEVLHDYLVNRSDILGESVAEREQQLAVGGLRIHTTLDPDAQSAALVARDELPENSMGIDAAIVSIDTGSGAVRALSGASGDDTGSDHANTVVTPRQTGSATRLFITAAAVEAGVLADDVIDGRRGCRFPADTPSDTPDGFDFQIDGGVAGFVGSIRDVVVAQAQLCGSARLSHIVGLQTVVDTIYEMSASVYLDPTQASPDRPPLEPFQSLATGANLLSALDMASGMQTIANEGVHHDPYFVEYIDNAEGTRLYTHHPDPTRVLDATGSLETIDMLESVIESGTGRRAGLDGDRPAIGVTGTAIDSTNAWFVGATPGLATAVWVGDPAAYTPMRNIAEFQAVGVPFVQGGTFPAEIWKTFTDTALAETSPTDWASPPEPTRPAARLVLPGVDCLGGANDANPQPIDPQQPVTTVDPATDVVPCP